MGGNKSKPVIELTARQVLEKRAVDAKHYKNHPSVITNMKIDLHYHEKNIKTPSTISHNTNKTISSISNINHSDENHELDPSIFKEMSKWPTVKVSTSADNQILSKESISSLPPEKSAVLIRIEEEKKYDSLVKNATLNAITDDKPHMLHGRLSESQIVQLLIKLRDLPLHQYTISQAAIEYNLSEEVIGKLHHSVRVPIVNHIPDSDELTLAK